LVSDGSAGEGTIYERKRAEIVGTVPASYSPALHLALPTAIGFGIMIAAVARLHDVRAVEWIAPPLTLFGGFGLEWRAHKSILHKRMPGMALLYERHELSHHVIYTDEAMEMRDRRELFLILMPAYAIVLVFLIVVPFALALTTFATENAARLMVATSMLFFLAYEWLHMSYHLPKKSFLGRNRVIRALRELHRRHHDPRLMKKWNFNVNVPVFDWIHGTIWSEERERSREARRAARTAEKST
jgi:hypothetical protein